MQIKKILIDSKIIREGKEIKKDTFKYFYIDEIKNIDSIPDIEALGDKKNIEVKLVTDENYTEDGKGAWFKIDTEDIIKCVEDNVDKYEAGDYMDFMGSFGLADWIVKYIESEFTVRHYKEWSDFARTMESEELDLNKLAPNLKEAKFMKPPDRRPFTKEMLDSLRKQFGAINTIDPMNSKYNNFIKILDNLSQDRLRQLASANIKFISKLAKNRLVRTSDEPSFDTDEVY